MVFGSHKMKLGLGRIGVIYREVRLKLFSIKVVRTKGGLNKRKITNVDNL